MCFYFFKDLILLPSWGAFSTLIWSIYQLPRDYFEITHYFQEFLRSKRETSVLQIVRAKNFETNVYVK